MSTSNDTPETIRPPFGQEIFYLSPRLRVDGDRNNALYTALCAIGPPPIDETMQQSTIQSGMAQFEGPVTGVDAYFYRKIERQIHKENLPAIGNLLRGRILIEPGIGGALGGQSLGELIMQLPEAERPIGLVLIDQPETKEDARARKDGLCDDTQPIRLAKKKIESLGYRKPIKTVSGDMFDQRDTWGTKVARAVHSINYQVCNESYNSPVIVRFTGPLLHDFDDAKLALLTRCCFGVESLGTTSSVGTTSKERVKPSDTVLWAPWDYTMDREALAIPYCRPANRQFSLTTLAYHCNALHLPEAISEVILDDSKEGCLSIRHIVTDGRGQRFEIEPFYRWDAVRANIQQREVMHASISDVMTCQTPVHPGVDYRLCVFKPLEY